MQGIPTSDQRRIILPLDSRFNANINQMIDLNLIDNRCHFGMILKLRKELQDFKLKKKTLHNGILLIFLIIALFLPLYIVIKDDFIYTMISLVCFLMMMSISIFQTIKKAKPLISEEWIVDKLNKDINCKGLIMVYNGKNWFEIWKTESYGLHEMQNILNGTSKVLNEIDPIWNDIKDSFLQVADYYLLAEMSGEPSSLTSISSSNSSSTSLSPLNNLQGTGDDNDYFYNDIEDQNENSGDINEPLLGNRYI